MDVNSTAQKLNKVILSVNCMCHAFEKNPLTTNAFEKTLLLLNYGRISVTLTVIIFRTLSSIGARRTLCVELVCSPLGSCKKKSSTIRQAIKALPRSHRNFFS